MDDRDDLRNDLAREPDTGISPFPKYVDIHIGVCSRHALGSRKHLDLRQMRTLAVVPALLMSLVFTQTFHNCKVHDANFLEQKPTRDCDNLILRSACTATDITLSNSLLASMIPRDKHYNPTSTAQSEDSLVRSVVIILLRNQWKIN
ncbi:hypothetical protein MAR_014891 [Mya arenaria]|uniref:Uncharacterized protein n=1 Tax=Mya arenaria TaxID=6604 RepID=A0ABY7FFK3_MYAAR|nr:hypothetical protein MAR_014891 [Mya arenaria]